MLVNVPNINNNDDATPELFNSRFADIVDVINGNIEADNVKDGTLTYSKLAISDKEFPVAKIGLDPSTSSGATRDQGSIVIGTFLVQWGESDISSTGTTVTFTSAYATNPTVVLTGIAATNIAPYLTAKSTTNFSAKCTGTAQPVGWIAIGKAA